MTTTVGQVLRFENYGQRSQVSGPPDTWALVVIVERLLDGKVRCVVIDSNSPTIEPAADRVFTFKAWYRVTLVH